MRYKVVFVASINEFVYHYQIVYNHITLEIIEGSLTEFLQSHGNGYKLMTSKTSLIITFLFIWLLAGVASSTTDVYIIPAISDIKVLPSSSISSSYLSDSISIRASPDEYTSASFVINSDQAIDNLQVSCTDLSRASSSISSNASFISKIAFIISSYLSRTSSSISSNAVDIRAVKCWYQGSHGIGYKPSGRYLTPELLLHDDSLIDVEGDDWTQSDVTNPDGVNYLKVNGNYINISNLTVKNYRDIISISTRPITDPTTIQPLNLSANCNKQFWITLHVPNNTKPGNYTGIIYITNNNQILKKINLELQVLSIILPSPDLEYCIYYRGTLETMGSISSEDKSSEQYTAEMQNMLQHGVTTPTTMQYNNTTLLNELSIRQQVGINNSNIFRWVPYGEVVESNFISYIKNITAPYGVNDLYIYGPDETNLNNLTYRTRLTDEHIAGAKHFNAQMASEAEQVADILDTAVVGSLDPKVAAKYHSYGNKVYLYGDPQVCPELPRTFRLKYGLALWQADYDGAMDYAYQTSEGDIYNDFDATERDFVFAYPTSNGVIDTVQWEGFREGVNDVRYVNALENAIAEAKDNGDTITATEAENYLTQIKNSNLNTQDLDGIRSRIIDYIVAFSTSSHYLSIDQGTGSGFYPKNTHVTITANTPTTGMVFDSWKGDTKYVINVNSASTKVTTTNHTISLTATYKLSDPIGFWYDTNYKNRSIITFNHNYVSNGDQTNFPALIHLVDNDLKTVASGGHVQSGYDIIFALPDKTLLADEIEYYNGATGEMRAWVKIPTLSASINTTICMYYNNSQITSSQENETAVWGDNFVGVWHLDETGIGAAGDFEDSTSYLSHSVNTANQPTKTSLWYGGAQSFDGSSQYLDLSNGNQFNLTTNMTIGFLINKTSDGDSYLLVKNVASFGDIAYGFQWIDETNKILFFSNGSGMQSKSNMVAINTPYYFDFTYDGKNIHMYVNGRLGSSSTWTTSIPTNMGHLVLATRNGAPPSFRGTIGEVHMSNVARSSDWIQTEYNNMVSPSTFSVFDESIDS